METLTQANFKMANSVGWELINGKMAVSIKVSLWKERDKEKENGKAIMEIYSRASTSKISKMVGVNLLGQMDKSIKENLETTLDMDRVLTDIRMVK